MPLCCVHIHAQIYTKHWKHTMLFLHSGARAATFTGHHAAASPYELLLLQELLHSHCCLLCILHLSECLLKAMGTRPEWVPGEVFELVTTICKLTVWHSGISQDRHKTRDTLATSELVACKSSCSPLKTEAAQRALM